MPQLLQPLALTRLTWLTGHVLYVDDVVLLLVFGADTLGGLWGPELQHAALDASSLYLSSLALGAR